MADPAGTSAPVPTPRPAGRAAHVVLAVACLLVVAVYASFANLKGIGTDEGFRLGIINGGNEYTADVPGTRATWGDVMVAITPYAYQPLYFLLQNSVMRIGGTHDELVLKGVNIFFLWLALQGLLVLARGWALVPRLFLVGLFSLNAFLFMHVLQLREYIMGIAFYVWSTWLALRLAARPLERPWADAGWFAAYGVLLVAGFFTQTWAVFPAVAQGVFLLFRRAGDRLRYYTHLALSYLIVLSMALPYLETHRQKVDIGRWGTEGTLLWPRIADGFHLVLSGHSFGQWPFTDFLFWGWLGFLAAWLLLLPARGKSAAVRAATGGEDLRQARFMVLCLVISVAFQVWYFHKVDTLSVWPRYFALHYFFTLWLVALAFKCLYELAVSPALPRLARGGLKLVAAAVMGLMLYSGFFQSRSYSRQPYLDSGLSAETNWRVLGTSLDRVLQPGDVLLTQDFVHSWTLTFTHTFPNPVLSATKLDRQSFPHAARFIYLVTTPDPASHPLVVSRLAELGYGAVHGETLAPAAGAPPVPNWSLLVFQRR